MKNLLFLLVSFLCSQLLLAAPVPPADPTTNGCSVNPPNTEVTILFVYTTSAAISAQGPKNIKRDVDFGVNQLNTALTNSQIPITVRAITEYVEVEYGAVTTEAAVGDLITELRKPNGKFNKVHQFRQQKKADIVCLIFSGYQMGKADLDGAFMVCHYSVFPGTSYVFPHEFGHVFGATHEAGMTFVYGDKSYRTITATGGEAIPYFSDNRTISIPVAGVVQPVKLGDATRNNTATIKGKAAAKSVLGEALTTVPNADGALPAKLVDPSTAPMPGGSAPSYTVSSFTLSNSGLFNIKYTCTDAVPYKIEGFDAGGSFGGFGSNLSPSQTSLDVPGWAPQSGDRYELKINNTLVKTISIP